MSDMGNFDRMDMLQSCFFAGVFERRDFLLVVCSVALSSLELSMGKLKQKILGDQMEMNIQLRIFSC